MPKMRERSAAVTGKSPSATVIGLTMDCGAAMKASLDAGRMVRQNDASILSSKWVPGICSIDEVVDLAYRAKQLIDQLACD